MKEEATKAKKEFFMDTDEMVAYLQKCKEEGENVYVDFNGHRFYSTNVTLDDAYIACIGITKEEDEIIQRELDKAKTPEERDSIIIDLTRKFKAGHAQKQEKTKSLISGLKDLVNSPCEITEVEPKGKTGAVEIGDR